MEVGVPKFKKLVTGQVICPLLERICSAPRL